MSSTGTAAPHHVGQREVGQSDHSGRKTSQAENFTRSAIAPLISAAVMIAKVIWNIDEM